MLEAGTHDLEHLIKDSDTYSALLTQVSKQIIKNKFQTINLETLHVDAVPAIQMMSDSN